MAVAIRRVSGLRRLSERLYSQCSARPILSIPATTGIYPFGAPAETTIPLIRFQDQGWTVHEGEAWAVVSNTAGAGGKAAIFKTLLGQTRISPENPIAKRNWIEQGGLYPFLYAPDKPIDAYELVSHVSFRQRGSGSNDGAFFDYTARYGALWEKEEKITLRETFSSISSKGGQLSEDESSRLIRQMLLEPLLDLPFLTLSNGQTRRARIVKAILERPELLLLGEPLTGLDVASREILDKTLVEIHQRRTPRLIISVRNPEEVPSWITNVLDLCGGLALPKTKAEFDSASSSAWLPHSTPPHEPSPRNVPTRENAEGPILVDMENVNVSYGERKILKNVNWKIRAGDRWHLQGANGSGKTTLLALVTGDHPQSFVQDHLLLPAYSPPTRTDSTRLSTATSPLSIDKKQRSRVPSAHLRSLIGVVSPEMFDAFPRRHPGMSVWEAIGTGFDGGYVPRTRNAPTRTPGGIDWVDVSEEELGMVFPNLTKEGPNHKQAFESLRNWRVTRTWEVLEALGPAAWATECVGPQPTRAFAERSFSSLSPGEQRLVLLMRALVGRPPLVLLDEVWSGMDDRMILAARRYLRGAGVGEDQAVIVITHWEDEVPWTGEEVQRFLLGSN